MIADNNKKRSSLLQKKLDIYSSIRCTGNFANERDLLERAWLEMPDVVLIYMGDSNLNAFSSLQRIKAVTPEVKVVFYSEKSEYAVDAYEKGADYFLQMPADDIQIGRLIFRYMGSQNRAINKSV